MGRWFRRLVLSRLWLTFLVMVAGFMGFGAGTLNLFFVLRANVNLLTEYGWQAVADGGAQQLGEILLTAAGSMASYIVFKACEQRLVQWLSDKESK